MWPLTKRKESCAFLPCIIELHTAFTVQELIQGKSLPFLENHTPLPLSLCVHYISLFDWFSRILLSVLDLMLREGIS